MTKQVYSVELFIPHFDPHYNKVLTELRPPSISSPKKPFRSAQDGAEETESMQRTSVYIFLCNILLVEKPKSKVGPVSDVLVWVFFFWL